jgi:hypothetical protein
VEKKQKTQETIKSSIRNRKRKSRSEGTGGEDGKQKNRNEVQCFTFPPPKLFASFRGKTITPSLDLKGINPCLNR